MGSILIQGGTIITSQKVLNNHSLLIKDNKIEKITSSQVSDFKGHTIDAKGKVILPGFINAHTHFYSSFALGLSKASPSKNFKEILNNLWWRLDKKLTLEDCYYSALLALIQAIKKGTTTLFDHHASPSSIKGSLNELAKAVKESGLRASLTYEVSNRDGPEACQNGLDENIEFIKSLKNSNQNQIRGLFGLHASFTVNEETMEKVSSYAKDLDVGIHIHLAEDMCDQEKSLKLRNERVVERLQRHNILNPKTICAHGVHLNDLELNILKETDTTIVCNPQSNLNNAVGMADIIKMHNKGICYGLGTDAMTLNMLEELRFALWGQKYLYKDPSIGLSEVIKALWTNNPHIMKHYFSKKIGDIKEGHLADIILMDYDPPTPLDKDNFEGHLVFGLSQATVDTTIVNGNILMENKIIKNLDEEQIVQKSLELSTKLWKRF